MSTHNVRRGPAQGFAHYEEIPCDCAATMDHSIGNEVQATSPEAGEGLADVMRAEFPDVNERREAWGLLFQMIAKRDAAGEP